MVTSTNVIRGIPAIPPLVSTDEELRATVDALKEAVEVLTGSRGDPDNRAVTWGEATESGQTDLFVTNRVVETIVVEGGDVTKVGTPVAGQVGVWVSDGTIEGGVNVPYVELNGIVRGDVVASQRVKLGASARVIGNVYYNLIEMAIGAEINGKLIHQPEGQVPLLEQTQADSDAPTNIASAT